MIREAPAMTVRQKLGELLNEVQYRGGKVVITKGGKPVAAIVDVAVLERLRKLDDEFARQRKALAAAFSGWRSEDVGSLVDEAVAAARRKPRKR